MGKTLDLLLGTDPAKVKELPTGKIEIKRLSDVLGEPFVVTFRAGTLNEFKAIDENIDGGSDADEMKWVVYELTSDPNFKDQGLREKYKVTRPVDIVSEILLGGEIMLVYQAIMKISGFSKDAGKNVETVKN